MSLGDGMDGALTIYLNKQEVPANVRRIQRNPSTQEIRFGAKGTITAKLHNGSYEPISFLAQSGLFQEHLDSWVTFDLRSQREVEYYLVEITGDDTAPFSLGTLSMRLSNEVVLENMANQDEEGAEDDQFEQINSKVNGFDILAGLNFQTSSFAYSDQYGAIGSHNPEAFFTRLFRNKYEQDPSTVQVARGVELLNRGDRTQLQFLNDFALENAVLSVGSYNYTQTDSNGSSLAIPNVPLDVAAFGETALIYSALIGKAPRKRWHGLP